MSRLRQTNCLLVALCCLYCSGAAQAQLVCNIGLSSGAKGNGQEYDTQVIQTAVDECSQPGNPGTVVFQAGLRYLTATITLSNSVHVVLPENTSLLAGTRREDFLAVQPEWYLLYFYRCTNCSITGGGTLDGRGRLWVTGEVGGWLKNVRNFQDPSCHNPWECRPRLLGVRDSERVHLSDIELYDSIYWTLHILGSRAVTVQRVVVNNDFQIPNNDGIDVDSSKLVWISDCNVTAWDDGICIKANYPGVSTEDVLVENCNVHSRASAIKVGTESLANFRNLVIRNINVIEGHRALSIQIRDNGTVENVLFDNITSDTRQYIGNEWGGAEPIYVTALPRNNQTKQGYISGVKFQHIRAVSEGGVLVVGTADSVIQDLSIQNMNLTLRNMTDAPSGFHDLRPSPFDIVQNVSDDAIYLEQANHVNLTNIKVVWGDPAKPTWGQLLNIKPRTVHAINIKGLVAHDETAHPHVPADTPTAESWMVSKAQGLVEWLQSVRNAASTDAPLSLQENAAMGVQVPASVPTRAYLIMPGQMVP